MHLKTLLIKRLTYWLTTLCLISFLGCGGGEPGCPGGIFAASGCTASSTTGGSGGNLGGGGGSGNGSGTLTAPAPITVAAGQTTTANISVVAPSSSTPPNIQAVGVDSNGFAFATGGTATQGEAAGTVLLFGPGITGDMKIAFSGPNDITASNVQAVTSTVGTPGLQFNITVANTAALGSRTLILQSSNNDVTTFTGGIEIIP